MPNKSEGPKWTEKPITSFAQYKRLSYVSAKAQKLFEALPRFEERDEQNTINRKKHEGENRITQRIWERKNTHIICF